MTVAAMDLWPDEALAASEDVPMPLELLNLQAQFLERRTNGRLKVELAEFKTDDREVLRFVVAVPAQDFRCTLFEVLHRPNLMLPASFIPPEPLPNYLRERYVRPRVPSLGDVMAALSSTSIYHASSPPVTVQNEWVANTPAEFQSKLQLLLQTQEVKALLTSLVTMASKPAKSTISVTPTNGAE